MQHQYAQVATKEQVAKQIQIIASQILEDFPNQTPLFVALLRGAAPFSSRLMTEIVTQSKDYHPEIDYMMVRTYGDSHEAGEPEIVTDIAPSTVVEGRTVVIIDDVLDKGITADFVAKHFRSRHAASIKLAVLCDKRTQREREIVADYIGFEFNDNWLVGMGMDDPSTANEGYRWLDEIWEVRNLNPSGDISSAK